MHDLASIRAFDALNQHKSLTAAAKALNQPKSTLSRRLAQLEEDFGQALTARQGNRLVLTRAGEIFAHYSRQILELSEESYDALQGLTNQVSGPLHIVCHTALVRSWLGGVLNRFLADNPDVRVQLTSDFSEAHHDPDLFIWLGERKELDWRKEVLGVFRYTPFASPNYLKQHGPIQHPKELEAHPWIDFGSVQENGLMLAHPQHGEFFLEPFVSRLYSDNIAMQIDSIANGHGIGLLPTWTACGYEKHHPGRITPCLEGWLSEPISINCYTPAGRPPLRLSVLLDCIHQSIPQGWKT
ncbi:MULTISPECIES: LysR family transcriptional regulator [Vibrio]|uniref:LysR family transcriptional regulator n=1 Tax=Vibrio TaxID=662 RepID=UPI001B82CFA0|nr:LysR family transcriptional regulator [Vibrio alginolyticus]ELA9084737.1 LysR family transcriptional regulator [Vibrio alginolyticus]ELI1836225.1 LysR family transcriptional regulator [Vibrio alginolyticus]EMB9226426.1 LysR family transcriptional regulator [Vibrio alginolyticus]MBS9820448.1 LysR family transcriptional regulator [Vibrio alginolyticus]HBC3491903.1 LysR family transcriptional regulator [Vibrio alginolyticus]